jgi:hypothetical protein
MKLIKSEQHQCVAAAFAMAMDTTMDDLFEKLGHNGLEQIIDEDAPPPPACYRSFHPQEFTDILLDEGYALTMIELDPCLKHGPLLINHAALLGHDRFFLSLHYGSGVLFGTVGDKAKGTGHAVAWDVETKKIFDPRGYTYVWNKDQDFHPRQFFLIQKVEETCMMKFTTPDKAS